METIIKNHQDWDFNSTTEYLCINNNQIVYSFAISTFRDLGDEYDKNDRLLHNVYVQPEFRGKGYLNSIMTNAIKECTGDILIECRKGAWIIDKYIQYGFEYLNENDENYDWYIRFNKN